MSLGCSPGYSAVHIVLHHVCSKIQMHLRTKWKQWRKNCAHFAVRLKTCLVDIWVGKQESQAETAVAGAQCPLSLHHHLPSLLLSSQSPLVPSESASSINAIGQLNGYVNLAQDVWSLLLISVISCQARSPGVPCHRHERTVEEQTGHILYILCNDEMLLYI